MIHTTRILCSLPCRARHCPAGARAEPPVITVSKSDTISIAVGPISGPDGAVISHVLQSDLAACGTLRDEPGGARR